MREPREPLIDLGGIIEWLIDSFAVIMALLPVLVCIAFWLYVTFGTVTIPGLIEFGSLP